MKGPFHTQHTAVVTLSPALGLKQCGFSLIELMIGLAISLVLGIGIVNLFSGSKQTYLTEEATSRMQENARFAMNQIFANVSAAGFAGCAPSTTSAADAANITVAINTNTIGAVYDMSFPARGLNTDPDQFTIRRSVASGSLTLVRPMQDGNDDVELNAADPGYASLKQWDIVTLSDCSHSAVFMITNDPKTSGGVLKHAVATSPASQNNAGLSNATQWLGDPPFGKQDDSTVARVYRTVAYTYSIGNSEAANQAGNACNPADANDRRFCALRRSVSTGNPAELLEGVHGMEVTFGVDANNDQIAEAYLPATGLANWNQVISLRITLGMNSVQPVPVWNGANSMQIVTRNFTNTFRIRNRGV